MGCHYSAVDSHRPLASFRLHDSSKQQRMSKPLQPEPVCLRSAPVYFNAGSRHFPGGSVYRLLFVRALRCDVVCVSQDRNSRVNDTISYGDDKVAFCKNSIHSGVKAYQVDANRFRSSLEAFTTATNTFTCVAKLSACQGQMVASAPERNSNNRLLVNVYVELSTSVPPMFAMAAEMFVSAV